MLFLQVGQQSLLFGLADHVVGLALADTGIDKLLEKTINRCVDVSGKLFD
jgi:TctA family transporter